MTEYMYLYTPRGYSPGYIYRNFDAAVKQLLEDDGNPTLEELADELRQWDVWFEFGDDYISIDDGSRIEKIEVR